MLVVHQVLYLEEKHTHIRLYILYISVNSGDWRDEFKNRGDMKYFGLWNSSWDEKLYSYCYFPFSTFKLKSTLQGDF